MLGSLSLTQGSVQSITGDDEEEDDTAGEEEEEEAAYLLSLSKAKNGISSR